MTDGILWLSLGSAAGGMLRFALGRAVLALVGDAWPWPTLAVNLSGALLLGAVTAAIACAWNGAGALLLVAALGSYTTVSTFSLETLGLWRDARVAAVAAYVAVSVLGCLAAAALGHASLTLAVCA